MKYCEKCKVYVPSDREHCPLCQSILTEEDASRSYPGYDDEIFPYLPTIYHRHNLLIRLSLCHLPDPQPADLAEALVVAVCPCRRRRRVGNGGASHPQAQLLLQTCFVPGGHRGHRGGPVRPDDRFWSLVL